MRLRKLNVIVLLFLLDSILFPFNLTGNEVHSPSQETKTVLQLGYPVNAFSPGFVEDVKASLKVWGTKLAEKYQPGSEVEVTIFENLESIAAALDSRSIDLLVISPLDYIDLEAGGNLEPVTTEADFNQEFILIVHRDQNIRTLSDLEGGRCFIDGKAVGRIPQIWLDVNLHNSGLPLNDTFFREVKVKDKATEAVLPVFFGQSEACVTTRKAFETMCELNPQLDRELLIILNSPGMIRGLNCIRTDLEADLKATAIEALQDMSKEPEGQQILMMLGVLEVTPFLPEYLDNIRSLYKEYKALKNRLNKRD